ncbi:hypothetical protein Hanom_Chr10g00901981 [Helianthus anomalus]
MSWFLEIAHVYQDSCSTLGSNGRTGVKGLAKDLRFVERCEATGIVPL